MGRVRVARVDRPGRFQRSGAAAETAASTDPVPGLAVAGVLLGLRLVGLALERLPGAGHGVAVNGGSLRFLRALPRCKVCDRPATVAVIELVDEPVVVVPDDLAVGSPAGRLVSVACGHHADRLLAGDSADDRV